MSSSSQRLVHSLRVLGLVLLTLHILSPMLPEDQVWGLWPYTYLPPAWRWLLALAGVLACLPWSSWLRNRQAKIRAPARGLQLASHPIGVAIGQERRKSYLFAIIALGLAPLFWIGRLVHTRWGDAYILVNAIAHPEARLTYNWQAPLDIFLHAQVWRLGNQLLGWPDAMPAYWVLSSMAGVVFIFITLRLSDSLGRNRTEKLLIFGLVATLGTMQLFFGYVESYTLICVGILAYLWLSLRALRGEIDLWSPAAVLALTHGFHPSTLVLQPSLWYLGWRLWKTKRLLSPAVVMRVVAPSVIVGLGVVALMEAGDHGLSAFLGEDFPGGGDHRWLVPLLRTTTRWEHYTMFSWAHLLDVLNQQLLTAPAVLPALALTTLWKWRHLDRSDTRARFLLLAAGCYTLLILAWNPDYGGRRDWDLFAPASLPLTILLCYLLPRALPERDALRESGRILIAVQLVHTLSWIYQNTRPWSWPA